MITKTLTIENLTDDNGNTFKNCTFTFTTPEPAPVLHDYDKWLKGITYKPDSVFMVFLIEPDDYKRTAQLYISFPTKNVNNLEEENFRLEGRQNLIEGLTEQEFLDWVWYEIWQMELHEAAEWFQIVNWKPHDPHIPLPPTNFVGCRSCTRAFRKLEEKRKEKEAIISS